MADIIKIELDRKLAQCLVDDPTCWDHRDKEKLIEAIVKALSAPTAEASARLKHELFGLERPSCKNLTIPRSR